MPAHKKDDSVRRRTNSSSSAKIVLYPPPKTKVRVPALPTNIKWYSQVREWWKASWSSPMPQMWDTTDRHAMLLAARLRQQFWDPETTASSRNQTSAQIRAIDDQLGLTPMARHRMGWEIAEPEEGGESTGRRSTRAKPAEATVTQIDPRKRRIAAVK